MSEGLGAALCFESFFLVCEKAIKLLHEFMSMTIEMKNEGERIWAVNGFPSAQCWWIAFVCFSKCVCAS